MDLFHIVGIVVAVWIVLSALIVAVATAAGRADHRDHRLAAAAGPPARQGFPDPRLSRTGTRVPAGARAAIR